MSTHDVVLGARGLLGGYLVNELANAGREVVGFDRAGCDVADEARVRAAVEGARVVYNAAAWTDVDGAERDVEGAWRANARGAENVARAAMQQGAVVVHVSTDFVFDGHSDRAYDEFDAPNPQSQYARSKRAGEVLVEKANARHHVVRVQGLYGAGGRNFSSKLASLLRARKTGLRIDDERRVQPTFARAAARACIAIGQSDRFGTWHASCRGETTWHKFTERMSARLGLEKNWEAVPSSALVLPAPRPPNCLLETRRLAMTGVHAMPTWEDALDEYLTEERSTQ